MSDERTELSRAARARLAISSQAAELSDEYRALVRHNATDDYDDGASAGEDVEYAARLVADARDVLLNTVIHARMRHVSWEEIGEKLGGISKQAAHERYGGHENDFRRRALLAWLVPEDAYDYIGELADPMGVTAQLGRWQARHHGDDAPEQSDIPPGYARMSTVEAVGLIIEAANLLIGTGVHRDARLDEDERRRVEVGLARRKVQVYEQLVSEEPDNTKAADILAGARARLAELEGDEVAARRDRRRP